MPPSSCLLSISIHAPHEGERPNHGVSLISPYKFQSTLPTRGSDRRETDRALAYIKISIHAPHEGERHSPRNDLSRLSIHFNPRSPRGGATNGICSLGYDMQGFQSTLPTRGSDVRSMAHMAETGKFQSTLPTRGSDGLFRFMPPQNVVFQSTLPTRGSDLVIFISFQLCVVISIHAPHEGERRMRISSCYTSNIFQSTLPTRGSDLIAKGADLQIISISIHAPHEGERQTFAPRRTG